MQQCRFATLSLFQGIEPTTFSCQAHPNFSPIGWHLGHIGYTEAIWILEHLADEFPKHLLPYRRLYAADGLPKTERCHLPSLEETFSLLDDVRSRVFQYLSVCPLETQERLWYWLLQHESQHCETIAIVLELQQHSSPKSSNSLGSKSKLSPIEFHTDPAEMVYIPAGSFQCGNNSVNALDNEQPQHEVFLNSYSIDRYPVTQKQYRQFINADGYRIANYWHPEGWQWKTNHQIQQPRYWNNSSDYNEYPVCGISWYEADAYARFLGKRLPTEFEWEKAATQNSTTQQQNPFNSQQAAINKSGISLTLDLKSSPQSSYGCHYMGRNCWEWTSSRFQPYPGFVAYPYKGYSQTYFDNKHYVLRGGSWATLHWALRPTFRNWYTPQTQEIFSGFRCAKD